MIEVVIADHLELFSIGLTEVLAGQDDVRVVGQPQSPGQLLKTLKKVKPHVLVLSTDFLPVYPRIKRILKRRKTALLLLAERNDRAAFMLWLRAHGIVYRSMDGPVFVDAMRRVARGELFIQNPSSDIRHKKRQV